MHDPRQVADLIAEETNNGYQPSEATIHRWFKRYPEPVGRVLELMRPLADLDSLGPDFREIKMVRREGEWSAEITLLKRDEEGTISPMAPGVYSDPEQRQRGSRLLTAEWYERLGVTPPKYNLGLILDRYLLGDTFERIAQVYAETEGQTISDSTVRRLIARIKIELPHGRGPHHPPQKAS